ncbi:MAG: ribonucleoprotein [Candidatus Helarchaeota archaeon]|nr:ribonucleoprotein [Candidatus Helarchaeota archaeon]
MRNRNAKDITERNPLKTLQRSVNNKILVRLKTGHEYVGRLIETDAYMNLVLSEAEELEDGESIARFGEIFIRGNNILFIKPDITVLEKEEY